MGSPRAEHRLSAILSADAVGYNLLAEFGSAADAVACAVAIQDELGRRNAEVAGEERLPFRIGIEIGDVLVDGGRIAGESVNVAARLESLAPAGGLAISGAVRDQLGGRIDLALQDLGERRLHSSTCICATAATKRWGSKRRSVCGEKGLQAIPSGFSQRSAPGSPRAERRDATQSAPRCGPRAGRRPWREPDRAHARARGASRARHRADG